MKILLCLRNEEQILEGKSRNHKKMKNKLEEDGKCGGARGGGER